MAKRIETYGSVCSGIEAASFVLEPLGVSPLWLSEIADFPNKFLDKRYPHIPNLGDMNNLPSLITEGKIEVPDFLCGGTPCQPFSLAGWKNGLNDDRGQLTLSYIDILNAIDNKRLSGHKPRALFMWENVEGVLKDKTNAFGIFLAGLLGLDKPVECDRWPSAGAIYGRNRNIAWRVLDAKYFGIPQQRKRLYVVGGGSDFSPAGILFERGRFLHDPYSAISSADHIPSLFGEERGGSVSLKAEIKGHRIEVFRQYSDCLYAAYGTKWNGNAASFNGSLFVCQDGRVRRLTPLECERLMGFPDNYTAISSKARATSRYRAIGNSWAIPVVEWILSRVVSLETPHIQLPEHTVRQRCDDYTLHFMDGFVGYGGEWLNTSQYPYDYSISHMLDIVDTDADEKYYLSPAGCAGIVRRKIERNSGINERLEYHLRNGFGNNLEMLEKSHDSR